MHCHIITSWHYKSEAAVQHICTHSIFLKYLLWWSASWMSMKVKQSWKPKYVNSVDHHRDSTAEAWTEMEATMLLAWLLINAFVTFWSLGSGCRFEVSIHSILSLCVLGQKSQSCASRIMQLSAVMEAVWTLLSHSYFLRIKKVMTISILLKITLLYSSSRCTNWNRLTVSNK